MSDITRGKAPWDLHGTEDQILPNSEYSRLLMHPDASLNLLFTLIEKRFIDIEDKIYKSKRKIQTTRAQQMLLLMHLGFVNSILDFKMTVNKKAKLLSLLLNASAENIEGDLSQIQNEMSPELATRTNYEFLVATFKDLGMEDQLKATEVILEKINKREAKKQK
jgi:hypothetical protein